VSYKSITAACKALGVGQSTVDSRFKRIPEKTPFWVDACFDKVMPKPISYAEWKKKLRVRGKMFTSIREASEALGSHYPTSRRRLSRLTEWVTQEQIDRCFRNEWTRPNPL